jgi:hypothetical protein
MDNQPDDTATLESDVVEAELLPIIRAVPWTRETLDTLKRQLQFTADIHAGYDDHSLGSNEHPVESLEPSYLAGPPGEHETEAAYADRIRRLTEKLKEDRDRGDPPVEEYD